MLLKSTGQALILCRSSFTADDGSIIPSAMLYDPDTRMTFSLYGPSVGNLIPEDVDASAVASVSLEWSYSSKRGWRPRLLACSF